MNGYLTTNQRCQVAVSGQWRCRMPYFPPHFPFHSPSITSANSFSTSSHRAHPPPLSVPRTLVPLPAPITFHGLPTQLPSASCTSRISVDVNHHVFGRPPPQGQNEGSSYSSHPPTIGSWSDRLLYGSEASGGHNGRRNSENLRGSLEGSRNTDYDPLESFLSYLNDVFPDMSEFERPSSGCRLAIKEEDSSVVVESKDEACSDKGAILEWDDDYVAFNESLALKEPDLVNPVQAQNLKKQENGGEEERIVPRKLKQSWIKSSQLEAERQAQSSGRSLRLEWPSPSAAGNNSSKTSYSWGPCLILAPFWIDVNRGLTTTAAAISESQSSLEEDCPTEAEDSTSPTEDVRLKSVESHEEAKHLKNCLATPSPVPAVKSETRNGIAESQSSLEEDSPAEAEDSTSPMEDVLLKSVESSEESKGLKNCWAAATSPATASRHRKKRKQLQPRKSPPLVDPTFKGVVLRFETVVRKKSSSQVLVHRTYSNVPSKSPKLCRPRKQRRRYTYSSSDSYSDLDENFLCQDAWISCPGKQCTSCGAKKTPLWRDAEDGTPLCNACGIRYRKYRLRCPLCWYIPRKDGKSHARCGCCGANLR